ncbi:tumor necrosis factor receptor superfamily member 4-like isoform X1 [Paramuricea clavata]|uniref:Tumor necrosis factor receptor superfamily member 4-like isoform X1 n=1 Tax=Paramuricea clavata TaxID=317549 RepID=A0A7D9IG07_PARCT|nr:tumor necrosis factor receptor superfamily member 4-like isoform X1 [Paramuricea clavata]
MFKMKMFKSFVLVFMAEHIHWSIATKCGLNQITIIQNRSEHCVDCVQCPKGMGSIPQCGSFLTRNTTVTCKACVKGVSYSESHDHTSCKQCRICVENEEVIKNCTATSDGECGECKPGYYRSFVFSCVKCSPCCQDTQEDDVEPQCLKQGFSRDRACRYTGRNCGGMKPTSMNSMVFKSTASQELEKSNIPLPYIIGLMVFVFVVFVLALLVIFLMYRVYGAGKGNRSRVILRLQVTGS